MARKKTRNPRRREQGCSLAELKRDTFAACDAEYGERWGEVFIVGDGSIGGSLVRRVEGQKGKATVEASARACYERLRKRRGRVADEARKWVSENEALTGHLAAWVLWSIAREPRLAGLLGSQLPPLSAHRDRFARILPPEPGDGFSEATWLICDELSRPPIRQAVTNREVAVILILLNEAPTGWVSYDRRLRDGENLTAAVVIKDVEKRVRDVIGSDLAGAIRTRQLSHCAGKVLGDQGRISVPQRSPNG